LSFGEDVEVQSRGEDSHTGCHPASVVYLGFDIARKWSGIMGHLAVSAERFERTTRNSTPNEIIKGLIELHQLQLTDEIYVAHYKLKQQDLPKRKPRVFFPHWAHSSSIFCTRYQAKIR
jgi:hypothetical protein